MPQERTPHTTEFFSHTPKINDVPDTNWSETGRDLRNGTLGLIASASVYLAPAFGPPALHRLGRGLVNVGSNIYTQAAAQSNYMKENNLQAYELRDALKQQREGNKVLKEISRETNELLVRNGTNSSRRGPFGLKQHKQAAIEIQHALVEEYGLQLLDLSSKQKSDLQDTLAATIKGDRPDGFLWGKSFPSRQELQASCQNAVQEHKTSIQPYLEAKTAANEARTQLIKDVITRLNEQNTFTESEQTSAGQNQRYYVTKTIRRATADLSAATLESQELTEAIVEKIQAASQPRRRFFSSTPSPHFATERELKTAIQQAVANPVRSVRRGDASIPFASAPASIIIEGDDVYPTSSRTFGENNPSFAPAPSAPSAKAAVPAPKFTLMQVNRTLYIRDSATEEAVEVSHESAKEANGSRKLETEDGRSFIVDQHNTVTLIKAKTAAVEKSVIPPKKPAKPAQRFTPSPVGSAFTAVPAVAEEKSGPESREVRSDVFNSIASSEAKPGAEDARRTPSPSVVGGTALLGGRTVTPPAIQPAK